MKLFISSLSSVSGSTPIDPSFIFDVNGCSAENVENYLDITTYDGSGQNVHPSVLYDSNGWNGYKYWMATTPYPGGNDDVENPSILCSNDGVTWIVPIGLTNPIDEPTPSEIAAGDHMSDCHLLFDDGQLHCMYRFTVGGNQQMLLMSSSDGINWSSRHIMIEFVGGQYLSPSLLKVDGVFYFWITNSAQLRRYSATDLYGVWGDPTECTPSPMFASGGTFKLWHQSITKEGDQFHCIGNFQGASDFYPTRLYFMVSDDGIAWTISDDAFLSESALGGWQDRGIYRSCVVLFTDTGIPYYKLFYSAINSSGQWRTGLTNMTVTPL